MGKELNVRVFEIKNYDDNREINRLIDDYQPFVLKVVTEMKNGYVDLDNDDEFSVGLMAFHEAVTRYNIDHGDFLSFARLVIQSRLKNFWMKENAFKSIPLNESDIVDDLLDDSLMLKEEIERFEKTLMKFGLSFEVLIESSPKHRDTIENARAIVATKANRLLIIKLDLLLILLLTTSSLVYMIFDPTVRFPRKTI